MNRVAGPARLLVLSMVLSLIFLSAAWATTFTGTPSDGSLGSTPLPLLGTLIDFDKGQPVGADLSATTGIPQLASNAYASYGVTSITETSGMGFLGLFSPSPQSPPNYVGIADTNDFNGTGTILIQLANPADKVGIGISDSLDPHTLQIFGPGGPGTSSPLETLYVPASSDPAAPANTYVGFERLSFDIDYFEITGSFFLIDDLQFESQPVAEPGTLTLLSCSFAGLLFFRSRRNRPIPTTQRVGSQ